MDTVIIKIYSPNNFRILDFSSFLPELEKREFKDLSDNEKRSNGPYLRKYILQVKKQKEYTPRVEIFETITKDRKNLCYILKIEFSIPKLLYWNSLQEVGENDGEKVFYAIKSALANVNILVGLETIKNSSVTSIHVCKNILLPPEIKMREIIDELAKIDINRSFDISNKQCKEGSRILNLYSGTTDWSFYDKISDSLRPKNKRTDKNKINQERLFIQLHKLQKLEVFRYEYRLKKNQTVKREINKILKRDYKTTVCLKDLFLKDLIKTILINSWQIILNRPENQLLFSTTNNDLKLFIHIFSRAKEQNHRSHSMNNAFIAYGIARIIKDHGIKETRGVISEIWNTDHPERFKKKIEIALKLTEGLPYSDGISFINEKIKSYELIDLTSLKNAI